MPAIILKTLTAALIKILQPITRILLRNGMSFITFNNIAKWIFVDTAAREFGISGRKQSISRISVITGLSRKEVKRVMEKAPPEETAFGEQYNRAARVIAAWRRERDYTDPDGNPRVLSAHGQGHTFAELVRKFSGDLPYRAVLDELVSAGTVERVEEDSVKLLNRSYVPGDDENMKLHILGTDVGHLASTIDHNLKADPSGRFFQRKVSYDNLPKEVLPVFHELAAKAAQKLLEDLDRWLADHDRDTHPDVDGTGRYGSGLGVYYFEEPVNEED
jgi:hypothetical protein